MNKIIITGRLPGRNEAENAARTHWARGAKLKKEATELVAWECKTQHVQKIDGEVIVEVTFYERDRRRDADNVLGGLKYILDGLVVAGVLTDDSRKYVELKINPVEVDKTDPRIEVFLHKRGEQQNENRYGV